MPWPKGKPFPHSAAQEENRLAAMRTPAYRARMSASLRVRPFTPEHRANISRAQTGKPHPRKFRGVCDLCGEHRELNKDHDHETGVHRGVLCNPCNIMIGFLEGRARRIGMDKIMRWIDRGQS